MPHDSRALRHGHFCMGMPKAGVRQARLAGFAMCDKGGYRIRAGNDLNQKVTFLNHFLPTFKKI